MENTELLTAVRSRRKLYERCSAPVCRTFDLTQTELDVLAFLGNHPGADTAGEIVRLRMLPKANVSQAVETLTDRQLVTAQTDAADRRRIHLHLTDAARAILPQIAASRAQMAQIMLQGFSAEEKEICEALQRRIDTNIRLFLEESEAGKNARK